MNGIRNWLNSSVHQSTDSVTRALAYLRLANILTPDNRQAVVSHQNPYDLAVALRALHCANILTPDNRQAVVNHPHPHALAVALESLHYANILNQANFTALLNSPALINADPNIFARIPDHLMNQDVFNNLIRLANNNAIQGYVNGLLGLDDNQNLNNNQHFNDQQSTHSASVHKSVSESALNLAHRYHPIISDVTAMESAVAKLKDAILKLPDNNKNKVSKRCIKNLTDYGYIFTEKQSKISIRQLLALAYVAVNDQTNRIGTLEGAISALATGLYEIQRGDNLNDHGIDQGGIDRPICPSGAFNKIINSLEGIHPDCQIKFITSVCATNKLPIVSIDAAMAYLKNMAETDNGNCFINTMRDIQRSGIEIIWDAIKEQVKEAMFDEFGSLYNNKEDAAFIGFIENGQYAELENHNSFKELLQKAETNVIEQRHSHPVAQHAYDQRYGLLLYQHMQSSSVAEEQLAPHAP